MKIKVLEEKYGIVFLESTEKIPHKICESELFSVSKMENEISIVCGEKYIPDNVKTEKNFKILKIEEILDFGMIGIIAKISALLAEKGVSIFVISTYLTDYILIKEENLNKSIDILLKNKYEILK